MTPKELIYGTGVVSQFEFLVQIYQGVQRQTETLPEPEST
jgi:hypothetical protein